MSPSWNVAPTQETPVCRLDLESAREAVMMRWGFTPAWSRDGKPGPINARSESISTSGLFRRAFRERRCIVPISGFYEWRAGGPAKQPFYIRLKDEPIMCCAGVWEQPQEGTPTFAMLTTRPNAIMAGIHDRMPVILRPENVRAWLESESPPENVFDPFPDEKMEMHPVSTRVNSPRNNDPRLCEVAPVEEGLF